MTFQNATSDLYPYYIYIWQLSRVAAGKSAPWSFILPCPPTTSVVQWGHMGRIINLWPTMLTDWYEFLSCNKKINKQNGNQVQTCTTTFQPNSIKTETSENYSLPVRSGKNVFILILFLQNNEALINGSGARVALWRIPLRELSHWNVTPYTWAEIIPSLNGIWKGDTCPTSIADENCPKLLVWRTDNSVLKLLNFLNMCTTLIYPGIQLTFRVL